MIEAEFLRGIDNWSSHRPLLWLALEATAGSEAPVLELGMGHGSTPHLHAYCEARGRRLMSLDGDVEWAKTFMYLSSSMHEVRCAGRDWSGFACGEDDRFSVALVDHAPMERRERDVADLAARCGVIVVHDTEGRAFDGVWRHFLYRVDLRVEGWAWATAVSQTIDVGAWRGDVGGWRIS